FGRESVWDSLSRIWPILLILVLFSIALVIAVRSVVREDSCLGCGVKIDRAPLILFVLVSGLWIVLFSNNVSKLPPLFGFDRDGHLDYINYILQKKALPLADDGWQMYQPPLFYLLAASIISTSGLSASADATIEILRGISALASLTNL